MHTDNIKCNVSLTENDKTIYSLIVQRKYTTPEVVFFFFYKD